MKGMNKSILFLILIISFSNLKSQENAEKTMRIEEGNMILTLDLRWNAFQRYNIAKSFEFDSIAIEKVYHGAAEIISGNNIWKVKKVDPNHIELFKPLEDKPINHLNSNDIFIINDSWLSIKTAAPKNDAKSGINKLMQNDVFSYKNGIATFYLPSFKRVEKVYLSGSFNSWSTLQTPMQRVDSGWIVKLRLVPGKYNYKYITDGKWREDPNNYIRENDVNGGYNSVIYCTNYEFQLKGRLNAKKIVVAGNFNGWGFDEFRMIKMNDRWILPIYLKEGTYAYKFIIDGQWITDPENKDIREDANGNLNSFIGLGDSYLFKLSGFTSAKKVVLTGTFNSWSKNELLMERTTDGWQLPYILAPGYYEYKFIVDGKYMIDPNNPLSIGFGTYKNSILTFKPNFTFTINSFKNASEVILTGSFNAWNKEGYKMYKKNGKWILPLYLKPGKYLYKFIVDGVWYIDPENKLWENNEFGTGNSVLWIEP